LRFVSYNTATRIQLNFHSNLLCSHVSHFKANQFIAPVRVYKTKYVLTSHYSNHEFIKFIDNYGMLRSFYKNTSLPAFLVRSLLLKKYIHTHFHWNNWI